MDLKRFFEMLEADTKDLKEGMFRYILKDANGKALDIKEGMRNAITRRNELREQGVEGVKIERFD